MIQKRLTPGQQAPALYGLAWTDQMRQEMVVYPVPLNVAARWLRSLWLDLRAPI